MNESEINKLINSMTKKFKNGGFIECLRNGNKIADCKCGDKIAKAQPGSKLLNNTNAYIGTYPEFDASDSTWIQKDGRYIKNAFSGNDLYQNIVTYGEYGTPRRSVRIIKKFRTPDADTSRVDGLGQIASDNPGLIERIFGTPFSKDFKSAQDRILDGMDPKYSSEKEVKAAQRTQKKACGGPLPSKKKNYLKK